MSIRRKKVQIKSIWIAGAYSRLSLEDLKEKNESNSIISQKEIIKQYLEKGDGISLYDYYVDDGYSGTNFDRPDFTRLIEDIKHGNINTIIVKDLSRLGRNYIEAGNYLEYFFPLYNIRFISINDNIDSYKNPESFSNVIVSLKNLMNEEYCRDISRKVKASLLSKKIKGQFVSSTVPYGYKKDPDDKYKLIVDDEAAKVVKLIFELTKDGYGISYIANKLNNDNIPSPSLYKNLYGKTKYGNNSINDKNKSWHYWNSSQISRILDNKVYCGDVVQNKTKVIDFKNHKFSRSKEEDFIIVENMHEPIIDRDTFNYIYNIRKSKTFDNKVKYENIYAHHMRCIDCGATMIRKITGKRKSNPDIINSSYYCSTHANKGRNVCSKHKIRSEDLDNIILISLKVQIQLFIEIEKVINTLLEKNTFNIKLEEINHKIDKLRENANEKKEYKKCLYEDLKKERINEQDYLKCVDEIENEVKSLNYTINFLLEEKLDLNNSNKYYSFIDKFKKNYNIEVLTKEVIDDVIDTIYIYENENIMIKFKYEDEFYKTLELILKYGKEV